MKLVIVVYDTRSGLSSAPLDMTTAV